MRILGTALLALTLSACSGPELLNIVAPSLSGQWEKTTDLAYGELERHRFDIYTPTEDGPHPVLIYVHGGSWNSGSKDDYPWLGRRFAAEGYVTAVINYRLAPEFGYEDFMADTAKAVAFIHQNAEQWGGDPERLFLVGHSAGAYNAVQVALAPEFLAAEGSSPAIIDGVAGLAGPYDFLPLDGPATKAAFGVAEDLDATQPVNRVTADAPPMLFLHGDKDTVVRPRNSTRMEELLKAQGIKTRSEIYEGVDHIGIIVAVPLKGRAPVVKDINDFFGQTD
ncbi:alpha/beta hydrolase [Parvularcula sp. ZS-1/3]|uniref:Alpha/beta hydrolase n=1 Tax=Parvularcula mediterranea TaxID=2732508 RepID=A0A7Y3RKC4_9PROT|nr:alpha/beta hydrolase [Parvularcula mediterranea]NNU15649.1 alpha/beta hydrolase [Parvularcula mediterranea]